VSVVSPTVSIVVATWNCADQLEQFLESLLLQRWCDWQLVLLDNASTDGSDRVVEHARRLLKPPQQLVWSSEPDEGIYDAWNRGLKLATGVYLCFIGADDCFLDEESLGRIVGLTLCGPALITARNAYYSPSHRFLRNWGSAWRWSRMRESMNIAHPGMLIRRDLFSQFGGFDDHYRICGDYEWFLRLPPNLEAVHTTESILRVIQAGVSHTRIREVFHETFRAQRRHCGFWQACLSWCLNWVKYWRRRLIGLA